MGNVAELIWNKGEQREWHNGFIEQASAPKHGMS